MDIWEILKKATQIYSPSGNESKIRNFIKSEIEPYCDEINTDSIGNLIAHKRGGGKKIMLAAHCDEIGIVVNSIDEKGFIRFSSVGGLNVDELVNLRVRFCDDLEGVIGCEDGFRDKPKIDKLYIDIGTNNKKESEQLVSIGDMAVFVGDFVSRDDIAISKALDNRVGCAILMKLISEIENSNYDLYFVFTTQEEVGLRGARTVAYEIDPDMAIAIDVTDTGDFPSAPTMSVELGKGAAVKVMDRSVICDSDVRTMLIETAKNNNIPYQLEIMTDGGTDAGAIHLTRSGIKTGGVSVPTRYIHSPSEMINKKDVDACIKLLYKVLTD